jgi:hypothetical protein
MSIPESGLRKLALIAIFVLTAAFAGCGDDGSADETTSTEAGSSISQVDTTVEAGGIDKAQFVKQAETVCRRVRLQMGQELEALLDENQPASGTISDRRGYELARDPIFLPGIETHIEELQALGAPQGDAVKVEAMLAALQEGAEAGAQDNVKTFEQFSSQFTRFDKLARSYGIEGCVFK